MSDISRKWQARRPQVTLWQPSHVCPPSPEARMPPGPAGIVKMFRDRGHAVTVRVSRGGSLRYTLDDERERTALALANRYERLYGA